MWQCVSMEILSYDWESLFAPPSGIKRISWLWLPCQRGWVFICPAIGDQKEILAMTLPCHRGWVFICPAIGDQKEILAMTLPCHRGWVFICPAIGDQKEILAMTEEFSCALPSGIDSYDRDFSPYQDLNWICLIIPDNRIRRVTLAMTEYVLLILTTGSEE